MKTRPSNVPPISVLLPDFVPSQTRQILYCKLLVIMLSDSCFLPLWRLRTYLINSIQSQPIPRGQSLHDELRFTHYSKPYYHRTIALVYMGEIDYFHYDPGFSSFSQLDSSIARMCSDFILRIYQISHILILKRKYYVTEDLDNPNRMFHVCLHCIRSRQVETSIYDGRISAALVDFMVIEADKTLAWQISRNNGYDQWKFDFRSILNDREELKNDVHQILYMVVTTILYEYLEINTSLIFSEPDYFDGIFLEAEYPSGREGMEDISLDEKDQILHIRRDLRPIFWTNISISFITCSPMVEYVTFSNFLNPFDVLVWIGIIVSFISLGVFIKLVAEEGLFLALFGIVVENSSKTSKSKCTTGLLLVWTFAFFLVGNVYKSIVTNDITAPLTANLPTSLNAMTDNGFRFVDFKPFISQNCDCRVMSNILMYISLMLWRSSLASIALNGTFGGGIEQFPVFWEIVDNKFCFNDGMTGKAKRHCRNAVRVNSSRLSQEQVDRAFSRVKNDPELNVYFESETYFSPIGDPKNNRSYEDGQKYGVEIMANCKKSALIGLTDEIDSTQDHILGEISHLKRRPYVKLEETAFNQRKFFVISEFAAEMVVRGVLKLLDTGIYWKWRTFTNNLMLPRRSREQGINEHFQPQVLVSNLGIVFYLFMIGEGLAFAIFLREIRSMVRLWFHNLHKFATALVENIIRKVARCFKRMEDLYRLIFSLFREIFINKTDCKLPKIFSQHPKSLRN